MAEFWRQLWDFCRVTGDPGDEVLVEGSDIRRAIFFPNGRINYAENILQKGGDDDALIFHGEDGTRRCWSWDNLRARVAALQSALKAEGIAAGDHVAGIVANTPETAVAMIAVASIGAVWSSCSPDFGVNGILDRLAQISPKLLFCTDGYYYNGKWHRTAEKASEVAKAISSVRRLVVLPYSGKCNSNKFLHIATSLSQFTMPYSGSELEFQRVDFNDPLFVMFSSGTTGLPKCMVHSVGGSLIQHLKEHRLHCDIRPSDRLLFFTTCGWMMWNWLISGLASDATLILYDGSPLFPESERLLEIVESEKVSHFGASARYFETCEKAGVTAVGSHKLGRLRTILSTGSPLSPESFKYIYNSWKSDVCLSSISGGTDILGCFAGGSPVSPVYAGECQKRLLGMDVRVFDENGNSIENTPGELVCIAPHPSMPIEFFNDPEGEKYQTAYFDEYPNVWTHGDWAEITQNGGLVFYGRSDATLNVDGVRIGTSEIYRAVESLQEVEEALAIEVVDNGRAKVSLYVRLAGNQRLSVELVDAIREAVRDNASPRHVPSMVFSVPELPRTKSGKLAELAVKNIIEGKPVKNVSALANPECLEHFMRIR